MATPALTLPFSESKHKLTGNVFHCIDVANVVIYYSGLPVPELETATNNPLP